MASKSIELARVFVQLEAETKGLDGQLQQAERSLGRTAKFIEDNPKAAAGAMAAAFVAVGVQATAMAAEVDTAVRRVAQRVPDGAAALDQFKHLARELSVEFGLAQTEILGVMEAIADGGIASAQDLEAATRAVVLAQKASGRSFEEIVGALDTSLDAFGLAASDSQQILADLLATAKGSTNLADLGEVLAKIGPEAKLAGLDFQTTVAAIAAMQTQVTDTKGQVSLFRDVLKNDGVAGLEAYAAAVRPVGDSLKAMRDAAEENNNQLGSLQDRLKAQFNAVLIDLGTAILPVATKAFQGFVDLLTFISDDARVAKASGRLAEVRQEVIDLGAEARNNNPAIEKLANTLKDIGGDLRTLDFAKNLEKIPTQKLLQLQQDWQLVADNTDKASFQMEEAKAALQAIQKELAKRPLETFRKDTVAATTATTTAVPVLKDYAKISKEIADREKQAAEDRKTLADRTKVLAEVNTILADGSLQFLGNAKAGLKKLADEMLASGATTEQVTALLGKLFARVEQLEKKEIKKPFKAAVIETEALNVELDKVVAAVDETIEKQPDVKLNFDLIKDEVFAIAEEALRAAEQFGLIDGEAYSALGHIKDLVVAIDGLKGASFTQVLAGLPGIVASLTGLLGTIFGDSAADRERKRILTENTARLRELTAVTGDLVDAQSPGRKIAAVGSVLSGFGSFPTRFPTKEIADQFETGLAADLRRSGLTLADLDNVARDLGITIRDKDGRLDPQGLRALLTGIRSADTGAAKTFKGRLGTLDTGLQIGAIGADQEFGQLLGISGDNAISRLFKDFDPNDRAGGIAKLQQLFADLAAGKLSLQDFGDLSRSEFEDLIVRLIGILQSDKAISPFSLPTGDPNAGDVAVDDPLGPTLPPVPDPALASLADLTVEGNDYLAGILETLQSFQPIVPPSLQGLAGAASGGGLAIAGGVNVYLTVTPDVAQNPADLAQRVGDALVDEVLGRRFLDAQKGRGYA